MHHCTDDDLHGCGERDLDLLEVEVIPQGSKEEKAYTAYPFLSHKIHLL